MNSCNEYDFKRFKDIEELKPLIKEYQDAELDVRRANFRLSRARLAISKKINNLVEERNKQKQSITIVEEAINEKSN